MPRFTNEFQASIQKMDSDLKSLGNTIYESIGSNLKHYNRLLFSQDRLAKLHTIDS